MVGSGTGLEWFEYGETEDWQIYILPEGGGIPISGTTYGVNCTSLPGVKVELFAGVTSLGFTTSDVSGNYTVSAPPSGTYTVTASKDGFREETQQVVVGSVPVTLDFCGETGLIPDAPNVFYVVDCVANWKYMPAVACCKLDVFRVVDVVAAWKYPVT